MIDVFKMVRKYYDVSAGVKINFNTFSSTRGNKYKLQKNSSRYISENFHIVLRLLIFGTVCLIGLRLILLAVV